MKKSIFLLISIFVLSSCSPTEVPQSSQIEQNAPVISGENDEEKAKNTFLTFFDLVSISEFEKASKLADFSNEDSDITAFSEEKDKNNSATVLKNYCAATQTCLKGKVLETKIAKNNEYILTVQFFNPDGSIYVFGPCCGATEEQQPSIDKFEFKVKKTGENFKLMTPPLYRP